MSPRDVPTIVLEQFPAATIDAPQALGNHGGFSGARLWKVRGFDGPLCLRAWPQGTSPAGLHFIHTEMGRARTHGLDYVPLVCRTRSANTCVEHAGRLWDLTTWMPGCADFEADPSVSRLEEACTALARLHEAWDHGTQQMPCPAVGRRLQRWQTWQDLLRAGWRPALPADPQSLVGALALRAWEVLPQLLAKVPQQLGPWTTRKLPIRPCLCDVWHDHILFVGNTVRGIIDYGAVRPDHVAVDLARLLGSLTGNNTALFAAGLAAYRRTRPLSAEEEDLVRALDRTGTLLGAANWLVWLYHDRRQFDDLTAVARRLGALVTRVESWAGR
jgi:Ser/Thr protein kinase RdoA (MazF antagonist)